MNILAPTYFGVFPSIDFTISVRSCQRRYIYIYIYIYIYVNDVIMQVQLQQYMKQYREAEKALYKNKIMDRIIAENKKHQALEKQQEIENEFADMPSLE